MANTAGAGSEAKQLDDQNLEENQDDLEEANIISLRTVKLLKLRHNIKKLKKEVLSDISDQVKECKEACSKARTLIGELNDNITTREGD